MVRLPQAADLRREAKGLSTPAVRVRNVDYSPVAQGGQAIKRGLQSVAGGLDATWKAQEEAADYQTKKALSDFRLATEADLDAYSTEMQPGAAGWSDGWSARYSKRANQFVKGLPGERQKEMVQASLIAQNERLSGRATTLERRERDRYTEEGLGTTLTNMVGRVDRDPTSMRDTRSEGRKLIESADLSPAKKSVLLSRYRKSVETTSVQARLTDAKTPEEFEAIRKDLEGSETSGPLGSQSSPLSDAQKKKLSGVSEQAINMFRSVQAGVGLELPINSGHRSREHNEKVGGASKSEHIHGKAIDIDVSGLNRKQRLELIKNASAKGFKGIGVYDNSIHLDTGDRRSWGPDHSSKSVPTWARKAIAGHLGSSTEPSADDDYAGPYKNLDAGDRQKLTRSVTHAERTFLGAARYEIKQQMQSDIKLLETTGEGLPDVDMERAKKFLEPNQVNRYMRQREIAKYAFSLNDSLSEMTDSEIVERFRSLAPARDADYAEKNQAYRKAISDVQRMQVTRSKDPAASIDKNSEVAAARADQNGDPMERARRIMDARLTAQERVGIPEAVRSPITEAESRKLLAPLTGLKGVEIYPELIKLVPQIVQQYGEYSDEALRYMSRTLYRDSASQEIFTGIIQNIKDTGAVEAAEKARMAELAEINSREGALATRPGGAGSYAAPVYRPPAPQAVEYLKAHPDSAEMFDQRYGKGAAAIVLGK